MSRLVVLLILACGACGSPSGGSAPIVRTTGADISSIGQHATYTHETAQLAPGGYERGALAPALMEKVRLQVDSELARKGYTLAENGDLIVRTSTGNRTVEHQPTTRAEVTAGVPGKAETEAALVVDIFERASGRQVFHGFARDVVRKGAVEDRQIAVAVTKLLEPLPRSQEGAAP